MLCDLLDCYVSTINCTSGANLGPSMKVSYDSYIDRFALCPKIILILHMNAEQGVHFLLTSFSPIMIPPLQCLTVSYRYTALHSAVCRLWVPGGGTRAGPLDCDVSRNTLKNTSLSASPQTTFKKFTCEFSPPRLRAKVQTREHFTGARCLETQHQNR